MPLTVISPIEVFREGSNPKVTGIFMRKENRHGQEECYISVDMDTGGMATSQGISGLPEAEKAEKYPSP